MIKPYYEQEGISIYHADCRDVLPTLPRRSVDLLLADPPYGVQWEGTSTRTRNYFGAIAGDDGTTDMLALIQLALHPLPDGAHVYLFGRWDITALPLSSPVELIWDKGNTTCGNLSLPWGTSHEPITFASYWPSAANRAQGRGRLTARLRQGSVLRVPRIHGMSIARHPTEKPVLLLRQLIESSSLIGDTVLDPFMGSGSTLAAAQLEGRKAIGIEIEERYCEIAANRLRQQVLPLEVTA